MREMSENSLKNLTLVDPNTTFLNSEVARKAQKKSAQKRKENRVMENTIKSICKVFCDTASSEEVKKAFANVGFEVDTKLQNLIAQVFTQGMSSKATIKDKIALLEFIGKYTGQEPAQKVEIEDKPIINIDIPR